MITEALKAIYKNKNNNNTEIKRDQVKYIQHTKEIQR